MVRGMKNATKEPTRTKLSSTSKQLPFLNTLESSCSPKTGTGMEIPEGGLEKEEVKHNKKKHHFQSPRKNKQNTLSYTQIISRRINGYRTQMNTNRATTDRHPNANWIYTGEGKILHLIFQQQHNASPVLVMFYWDRTMKGCCLKYWSCRCRVLWTMLGSARLWHFCCHHLHRVTAKKGRGRPALLLHGILQLV